MTFVCVIYKADAPLKHVGLMLSEYQWRQLSIKAELICQRPHSEKQGGGGLTDTHTLQCTSIRTVHG